MTPTPDSDPPVGNQWVQLRALFRQFEPTLLQTIAAVLPIGTYVLFDQGADVLSTIAEGVEYQGPTGYWNAGFFATANVSAGLVIWWTARTLLSLNFEDLPEPEGFFGGVRNFFQEWWPRILGVTPVAIIAWAFYHRMGDYCAQDALDLQKTLAELAWWHAGLAILMSAFFITRRVWLNAQLQAPPVKSRCATYSDLKQASPATKWINRGLFAVSVIIIGSVWASPIDVGRFFGTGALLSLAAVTWVTLGTIVVGVRARTSIPLATILVGWVAWCSHVMDNHAVRVSAGATPLPDALKVPEALGKWANQLPPGVQTSDQNLQLQPIFIVATEGGGIRAAYWTALVLGYLEKQSIEEAGANHLPDADQRDFARRLFAISGVSGGSVGAAVFDALLADKTVWPAKSDLPGMADEILGEDHLSPLLGDLLFPDAVQRFWPGVLPGTDRATAIEQSWERAYKESLKGKSDRLAAPFRSLWAEPANQTQHLPHLFLNSTIVDTGQRLIFSDLAVEAGPMGGGFMDAVDARTVVYSGDGAAARPRDVPLSTAAHASARFTYTNPAGKLTSGQRFVDGGYFEDSGTATALELVEAIERFQRRSPIPGIQLVPVVIVISNDPGALPDGARDISETSATTRLSVELELRSKVAAAPAATPCPGNITKLKKSTEPFQIASELLSPPRALMQTRGARGTFAKRTLCEHQRRAWDDLAAKYRLSGPEEGTFIQFSLAKEGIPLPLGWALSEAAKREMWKQIPGAEVNDGRSNTIAWGTMRYWLGLPPLAPR